jgi:hypothetical protein
MQQTVRESPREEQVEAFGHQNRGERMGAEGQHESRDGTMSCAACEKLIHMDTMDFLTSLNTGVSLSGGRTVGDLFLSS